MTVYIEYVIIDNLIIDYLMLKATFALTGFSCARRRLFLCALLGTAVALVYPLISLSPLILAAIKICSGLLIVSCAGKYKTLKSFYINAAVFFGYTFLTGGAVIGIFSIFSIPYSTEISVALMVVPVYFTLRALSEVVKFLYRKKNIVSLTYKIRLTIFGRRVYATGFMDTGNGLYDGDRPVIVCGKKFFKKLISDDFLRIKFKKIPVLTVSGKTENLAFRLDELILYISDEPNIYNNVTVVAADESVGEGYDVILHPALLEENYGVKDCEQTKKIS